MKPGIYWNPETMEITRITSNEAPPRGEWQHITDDTGLGLIATRRLLRGKGLVDEPNGVYWHMPQQNDEPMAHLYPACDVVDRPESAIARMREAVTGMFRRPSPSPQ